MHHYTAVKYVIHAHLHRELFPGLFHPPAAVLVPQSSFTVAAIAPIATRCFIWRYLQPRLLAWQVSRSMVVFSIVPDPSAMLEVLLLVMRVVWEP